MANTNATEPPTGRRTRRTEVTDRIKRYILDNNLRSGDLLPTEGDLCASLGVSRSSIREAVKTLDALDIVEVRHGHGTYVGRLSLSALVEGLTFRGMLSPTDDFRVLADLVDMRELIERGMAERILNSLGTEDVDLLDELVADMETKGESGDGFVESDRAFHLLLAESLGSELIHQLSSAFWDVYTVVAPHLNVITREDEQDTVAAHRSMVNALRDKDISAFTQAVTAHYAPVRRRIDAARARD